jgi:hypothetical protein
MVTGRERSVLLRALGRPHQFDRARARKGASRTNIRRRTSTPSSRSRAAWRRDDGESRGHPASHRERAELLENRKVDEPCRTGSGIPSGARRRAEEIVRLGAISAGSRSARSETESQADRFPATGGAAG